MSNRKKKNYRWIILVLISCTMIIAGIAIFLKIQSKLESEKEKESVDTEVVVSEVEKTAEELLEEQVLEHLGSMSLEEKVAQLFVVMPEDLVKGASSVTVAGDMTKNAINEVPVGGIIYMANNLQSASQISEMLNTVQEYSIERIGLPMFLCVDEEGGTVARVGGSGRFNVSRIQDMAVIGQTQDTQNAYEVGVTIGTYLSELGFNVDFAPVADVLTNSANTVVKRRSFGSDPQLVSDMALAVAEGLQEKGILSTFKHFPGHGDTAGDTHAGYTYSNKTLAELETCELIPFQTGIEHQIPFIMVGHISFPNVIGSSTPASISSLIVTDLLREKMGYQGIVITDAMNMGAISQKYSSREAAIMALDAGVDIVLMPANFYDAYYGVIDAVETGRLSETKIDDSVKRILRLKLQMDDYT